MKFTVTIKDNESGEILREFESNAIIAGVALENGESASIVNTSCGGEELMCAYLSTKKAMEAIEKKNPILLLADVFAGLQEMKKEDTDND
jgi:hypothetical protein